MKSFNNNPVNTLALVLFARLILEYQAIKLVTDEESNSEEEVAPEEVQEFDKESGQEEEGLTRGVDPARTRVVDPARTAVDPARTRVVDPARTR